MKNKLYSFLIIVFISMLNAWSNDKTNLTVTVNYALTGNCENYNIKVWSTVVGGTRPFAYEWFIIPDSETAKDTIHINGDSIISIPLTKTTQKIILNVKDFNGLAERTDKYIQYNEVFLPEMICLVTVDAELGKNRIVWEKTGNKSIKQYKILKETTTAGQFASIATIPFNSPNTFIDSFSNPSQHADRYKLETIDSCDNTSTSDFHQTIYLAINKGLPGTYNLIWTPYIGFNFSTYYIYKGSTPDNLKPIDSLANTYNQYTDTAAGVAYYQVAVRKSSPCFISKRKSDSEPFSQSVSNLEDNLKYVGINKVVSDLQIKVHPNPFNNELIVESYNVKPALVKIELYNVLGMKIYEFSTSSLISGSYKKVIQASEIANASEINILKVTIDDKSYFSKILKH
jgi:hypothetical protein